ncbi:MAG TPA: TraR/DksA family transcriptional regulator [Azonexus sp.]|nr:TraR/DksA family transcriptional regulator [Azonexus sp.]
MTDIFDRAQEREQEMRADAINEQVRRSRPAGSVSAEFCQMCDEPIPEARRQALPGVTTCIECQRWIEKAGPADWGMAE